MQTIRFIVLFVLSDVRSIDQNFALLFIFKGFLDKVVLKLPLWLRETLVILIWRHKVGLEQVPISKAARSCIKGVEEKLVVEGYH